MRATIVAMAGLLVLTVFVGSAQSDDLQNTEPYPVVLNVGEIFHVCIAGLLICPARDPICDDVKVVNFVDTTDGLAFKGISPGTTLCSVESLNRLRRIFRVTVR